MPADAAVQAMPIPIVKQKNALLLRKVTPEGREVGRLYNGICYRKTYLSRVTRCRPMATLSLEEIRDGYYLAY